MNQWIKSKLKTAMERTRQKKAFSIFSKYIVSIFSKYKKYKSQVNSAIYWLTESAYNISLGKSAQMKKFPVDIE
jgi:hypothetical protein